MTDAGRVAMVPRGAYNNATTYEVLDIVTYNSQSYVARQTTTGNLPTDTSNWMPLITLLKASMTQLGIVKVDGSSITVDADGTIHGHASAGVDTFNGRQGTVNPQLGDYEADDIAYINGGQSVTVSDELDKRFCLANQELAYASWTSSGGKWIQDVTDARITTDSANYVCFNDASLSAAAAANVVVDSFTGSGGANGGIRFTADSKPVMTNNAPLVCDIHITNP